jgi:hypothetical protein
MLLARIFIRRRPWRIGSRSSFYGGNSSSSSSSSSTASESGSGSVTRGGFGSFAHAFGSHFSGGG